MAKGGNYNTALRNVYSAGWRLTPLKMLSDGWMSVVLTFHLYRCPELTKKKLLKQSNTFWNIKCLTNILWYMTSKEGAMMLSSIVILVVCQLDHTWMCISQLCLNLQKQKENRKNKIVDNPGQTDKPWRDDWCSNIDIISS